MPRRSSKRKKRSRHRDETEGEIVVPPIIDPLLIVKSLVDSECNALFLSGFLSKYFPCLKHDNKVDLSSTDDSASPARSTKNNLLEGIVISPLPTLNGSDHIKYPKCREPLPSLIEDVVQVLVCRRDRLKGRGLDGGRNVLIDGYSKNSDEILMRRRRRQTGGIVNVAQNDNISFCKNSILMQQLHVYVGDEILRTILLHTRLFVPLDADGPASTASSAIPTNFRGNFIVICGPPLPYINRKRTKSKHRLIASNNISTAKYDSIEEEEERDHMTSLTNPNSNQQQRSRKKRRRGRLITTQYPIPREMEPNSVISRFPLFYSSSYIPKIGLSKDHAFNDKNITSEDLLCIMTAMYNENGKKKRKQWKRLQIRGIEVCHQILQRHRKCDYPRLLTKYCPLPYLIQNHRNKSNPGSSNNIMQSSAAVESNLLQMLGKQHTHPEHIVSFIASVLRRVFPKAFWGCEHNFGQVLTSVKVFVNLRRQEKLPNKVLMHGIRTTKLQWLQHHHGNIETNFNTDGRQQQQQRERMSRSDQEATKSLTLHVLRWLFRGFIIPLLRSNFYVTETEFSAKRVLYYRKPVWSMFRSLSMKKLLRKQFVELKESVAIPLGLSQSMGFSSLKLLPKATGVRPIAQLSRRPISPGGSNNTTASIRNGRKRQLATRTTLARRHAKNPRTTLLQHPSTIQDRPALGASAVVAAPLNSPMPTNSVLQVLFEVLKYECSTRPQIFGAGLDSLSAFYPRYHKYITQLKQRQQGSSSADPLSLNLVFASVDIEKCYDNICQPFLYDLVKGYFSHNNYIIQQFNIIRGSTERASSPDQEGRRRIQKKIIGPPEDYRPLHDNGKSNNVLRGRGMILEPGICSLANPQKLLDLLYEHLHSNLVVTSGRYGQRFLKQKSGIPQGSVLSMLLCNIYYGEIERIIFHNSDKNPQSPPHDADDSESTSTSSVNNNNFQKPNGLMARIVDDFIFVSTSKDSTLSFLRRMWKGRPDLGAVINRNKILVNTSMDNDLEDDGSEGAGVDSHELLRDAISTSLEIFNCDSTISRNFFPWCGMLFDADNGGVLVDYSRFTNERSQDSLTVDMDGSEGEMLCFRMKTFVKPRCLPIFYDPSINSKATIITNYYQMMLYAALKTGEYLKSINHGGGRKDEDSPPVNVDYFLDCIDCVSLFAQNQIRTSLRIQCPNKNRNKFNLSNSETTWLCWSAFHVIFEVNMIQDSPTDLLVHRRIAERVGVLPTDDRNVKSLKLVAIAKCAVHQLKIQGVMK